MIGCAQNHHHRYPVWEHVLEVTRRAPPEPDLRWAALLHDAGKPAARTVDAQGRCTSTGTRPSPWPWPRPSSPGCGPATP